MPDSSSSADIRGNRHLAILAVLLFSLAASSATSTEIQNASFEQAGTDGSTLLDWQVQAYGHDVVRDLSVSRSGEASLKIQSGGQPQTTFVRQVIDAARLREQPLRLTGEIRAKDVSGTATLVVIVNGPDGRLYLDDMRGRPVRGTGNWQQAEIVVPRMTEARSIEVGMLLVGAGTAWFDSLQIDFLPYKRDISNVARRYLDNALDIMQRHSIRRDLIDWNKLRNRTESLAAGAEQPVDTYPAIRYAVRALGDHHSSFFTPEDARRRTRGGPASADLPPVTVPAGRVIDGRIGYVTVPAYVGNDPARKTYYADQMQDRVAELDSGQICGWIVDLRGNSGGSVFPMLAGVGPILGEGDAGGGVTANEEIVVRSYRNGRSGSAVVSGSPYTLVNQHPPVAVLIGPQTASSGEAVALAFIGRPETRTFGLPSAGSTTGNAPSFLDDGAVLNLTVTVMTDRTGKRYGGKIEPDTRIDVAPGTVDGHDDTIDAAALWLRSRDACR